MTSVPLWQPKDKAKTKLWAFAERYYPEAEHDYTELHASSAQDLDRFWSNMWDFAQVIGDKGEHSHIDASDLRDVRFFPDAKLNLAENVLRQKGSEPAMLFADELGARRSLTWDELHDLVSRMQQALEANGVEPGDVVAAWLPNNPEAIAWMLAANSIGAIFSSCSPDFGSDAVLDRFGQIEPKILIGASDYPYATKRHDCLAKLRELTNQVPSIQHSVILGKDANLDDIRAAVGHDKFIAPYKGKEVTFRRASFDEPGFVLFSSGTTGKPKCIIHRSGGILMQHLKEHQLHCDIHPGDRVFYFATLGWMMWNWLSTTLASEATAILYDGSPMHPDKDVLWDLADEFKITHFGTSARYLSAIAKAGANPSEQHELSELRVLLSTGSPLLHEGFEFIYSNVKKDLHLASISGGTDLCACLLGGDPTGPVFAGQLQRPMLALEIDVVDDNGDSLPAGVQGELVCRNAFPSMPLGFWDDPNAERFSAAYFERFEGMWHQGDFTEWTTSGGAIIYGRSDATLNPGGVRIGTSEIYRQIEKIEAVLEGIVVTQQWQGDVRLVLFVQLKNGEVLDEDLRAEICTTIRNGASPRHVPAKIIQVPDLPRTRSGKLVELAVRNLIHQQPVTNTAALANPESLEHFENRTELQS